MKSKNYPGIVVSYGYGKVLPTNGFVEGDNQAGKPIDHFQSYSLKFLWQNPGYTDWQRIYNIPYWGFGFTHYSNGGLEHPNYDINNLASYIDLKYQLAGRPDIPEPKSTDKLELTKEIVFTGSYSRYQTISDTADLHYYFASGLSSYYLWQNSEAIKSGLGVDVRTINFATAEYLEFCLGYRVWAAKRKKVKG